MLLLHRMVYFDHNATAPLHPVARAAWLQAVEDYPGNPSSLHRLGSRAEFALNEARQRLGLLLACSPFDLLWTSGASEASNTVFHHMAATRSRKAEIWVSAIEHPCVLEPARRYFHGRTRVIPVSPDGVIRLDWLRRQLSKRCPALIVVMAANNETGVLQPWRNVLALCREHETPLFCDAVQWIGKLPVSGLGQCDFMSGSAHKFGGPKGVGFLKIPKGTALEPLIHGGPQENRRRAGTENVAGVLSMLAILEAREAALARGEEQPHVRERNSFEQALLERLPGSEVVGAGQARLWNTVSALMPPMDCRQRWVVKLDKIGCAVSTGSACSSGKEAPSHVLSAMGYSAAQAGRVLRFSSGWETTAVDWKVLLTALEQVCAAMGEAIPSSRNLARVPGKIR